MDVAVLPTGGLLFRAGTLDADTYLQVILFSVGVVASFITVMSYGDNLAKLIAGLWDVNGGSIHHRRRRYSLHDTGSL